MELPRAATTASDLCTQAFAVPLLTSFPRRAEPRGSRETEERPSYPSSPSEVLKAECCVDQGGLFQVVDLV